MIKKQPSKKMIVKNEENNESIESKIKR